MKVLLTGASGFLGAYVLRALRQADIAVVALGRTRPHSAADVAFIAADFLATTDFTDLARRAGASHLLHLAWVTEHGRYWTSPLNLRWVDASTRLVQAFCETGGQYVVVAGTCAEYDWTAVHCHEDSTALNPATLYGVAKDATRGLVMALCARYRVPCAWARIFFPFGAGEASARLLPSLVGALQRRAAPFAVNAQAQRDFVHADDVARGLLTLLRREASGSFNIATGQPVRIGDLVRTLAQLLGEDPLPLLGLPTARPPEAPLLVGDNLKLCALGWRQELSLVQGLERTLRDMSVSKRNEKAHGA